MMSIDQGVEDDPFPTEDRWIRCFMARPQRTFDNTVLGRCIIDSCFGIEPDEAICRIVGGLPSDHEIWPKLNEQCLRWLNEWRQWPDEKRTAYGMNAYVGTVIDVLSIVGRLTLVGVINDFKENYDTWMAWAAGLRLGPSHDPYWAIASTIAVNQNGQDRFANRWFAMIDGADEKDSWNDARNGLAALRHIPSVCREPTLWMDGIVKLIRILPDTTDGTTAFVRIWEAEAALFEQKIRETLVDDMSVWVKFTSVEKRWEHLRTVMN